MLPDKLTQSFAIVASYVFLVGVKSTLLCCELANFICGDKIAGTARGTGGYRKLRARRDRPEISLPRRTGRYPLLESWQSTPVQGYDILTSLHFVHEADGTFTSKLSAMQCNATLQRFKTYTVHNANRSEYMRQVIVPLSTELLRSADCG